MQKWAKLSFPMIKRPLYLKPNCQWTHLNWLPEWAVEIKFSILVIFLECLEVTNQLNSHAAVVCITTAPGSPKYDCGPRPCTNAEGEVVSAVKWTGQRQREQRDQRGEGTCNSRSVAIAC